MKLWWTTLAVVTLAAPMARALECTDDSVCGAHTRCRLQGGGGSSPGCAGGEDCDLLATKAETDVKGTCEPLESWECEEQADCEEGLTCEKSSGRVCWGSSSADGSESESGCEPEPSEPPRYGSCVYKAPSCATDDQCPAGLGCLEGGGDEPVSDGGSAQATEPAEKGTKADEAGGECGYERRPCETDAACGVHYICVESGQARCSGGADQNGVGGVAGEASSQEFALDQDPAALDTECEAIKECFPAELDCSNCPAGWTCTTFSADEPGELPIPESWTLTGTGERCFPEGLLLLAKSGGGYGDGVLEAARDNAAGSGAPDGEQDGAKNGLGGDGDGSAMCAAVPGANARGVGMLAVVFGWIGVTLLRRRTRLLSRSR